MRDKAYTYCKEAIDEIRAHGQFAFHDNAAKRDLYVSEYLRRRRASAKKTAVSVPVEAAATVAK